MSQMTQQQIAEKYNEQQAQVCKAVRHLKIVGRVPGSGKKMRNLYDEGEAVDALITFYTARRDNVLAKAEEWQHRADEAARIYAAGKEEQP